MKFEENWPRGFRGEVVQIGGRTMDTGRRTATDYNISAWTFGSGELKKTEKPIWNGQQ